MGQRGPLPAGTRLHRSAPFTPPPAPDYLTPRLVDEWKLVWSYLDETGRGHRVDAALVEAYVGALHLAGRAREEHAALGAPLTAQGSTGQPVEHPLLRLQREAMRDAAKYATTLGISPAGRARLGVDSAPRRTLAEDMAARIGPSPRAA